MGRRASLSRLQSPKMFGSRSLVFFNVYNYFCYDKIVKNAAQYGLSLFTTRLWLLLLASVFKREDKLLCVPA